MYLSFELFGAYKTVIFKTNINAYMILICFTESKQHKACNKTISEHLNEPNVTILTKMYFIS